jgi:hypothetical protein
MCIQIKVYECNKDRLLPNMYIIIQRTLKYPEFGLLFEHIDNLFSKNSKYDL